MISLTREERSVLIFFSFVLAIGTGLSYAIKQYPQMKNAVPFIESRPLLRKVNVNRASHEQLVAVEYIGDITAAKIIKWRDKNGPFVSLDQIGEIEGISRKNFTIFSQYLSVK
jgi:DNA uptake protein ComE-like DNA-binding protein